MGYQTEFTGKFNFNEKITKDFMEYINRFAQTRRMERKNEEIKRIYPKWKELCFNGELGKQGEYFAPDTTDNFAGQNQDTSIIHYNNPPCTQPGLWCDWAIFPAEEIEDKNEFSAYLAWDKMEKFYYYVDWLKYLIKNFIEPSNLSITGAVLAVGEEDGDATYIIVDNNNVKTYDACIDDIDEIKENYKDNSLLLNLIKDIETTPDTLYDEYWDY